MKPMAVIHPRDCIPKFKIRIVGSDHGFGCPFRMVILQYDLCLNDWLIGWKQNVLS